MVYISAGGADISVSVRFSPLSQVSVHDLLYQACADHKPDKAALWMHPADKDLRVKAHSKIRAEVHDMKAALDALAERPLIDWDKQAIQTW